MATTTTTQWSLDPSHTEIQFKVRHLMLSNVTGAFKSFTGAVTTEGDDFKTADIKFDAETASVDTSDTNRDNHLRSGEFFDAENHPHLSFQSHGLKHVEGDHYKAEGTLTIRGVAQPVELDAEFNYTFTYKLKPTNVTIRLFRDPSSKTNWLFVTKK